MAVTTEVSGSPEIFLHYILRGFMEHGEARGKSSFPAIFSSRWDELIYLLKQKYPREFNQVVFDSDGSLPVCGNLDDVMFGLHFICKERPGDLRIYLQEDSPRLRDKEFSRPQNFDEIVQQAFLIAFQAEGFFEITS